MRGARQPIAAAAPAPAFENPVFGQLQQRRFQELVRQLFCRGDFAKLHRVAGLAISRDHEGAQRVFRLLGQHLSADGFGSGLINYPIP
jgi:hypothetical protein